MRNSFGIPHGNTKRIYWKKMIEAESVSLVIDCGDAGDEWR